MFKEEIDSLAKIRSATNNALKDKLTNKIKEFVTEKQKDNHLLMYIGAYGLVFLDLEATAYSNNISQFVTYSDSYLKRL